MSAVTIYLSYVYTIYLKNMTIGILVAGACWCMAQYCNVAMNTDQKTIVISLLGVWKKANNGVSGVTVENPRLHTRNPKMMTKIVLRNIKVLPCQSSG